MSVLIEQYVPVVRENGIKTGKSIVLSGSANLDMSASSGVIKGFAPQILSGQASTVTLTSAQAGSVSLFDSAAGIVYTLPTPVPGEYFDFFVATTITSNAAKVITSTGTIYVAGLIASGLDNTANKQWVGNGTSHVAVSMNGTTTGGIIGSYLRFTAMTATLWAVSGTVVASGTPATPFATS